MHKQHISWGSRIRNTPTFSSNMQGPTWGLRIKMQTFPRRLCAPETRSCRSETYFGRPLKENPQAQSTSWTTSFLRQGCSAREKSVTVFPPAQVLFPLTLLYWREHYAYIHTTKRSKTLNMARRSARASPIIQGKQLSIFRWLNDYSPPLPRH